MSGKQAETDDKPDVRHPLVQQIAGMIAEAMDSRLLIVYPETFGWGQTYGDVKDPKLHAFCQLMQSTAEGAKHCRMSHILMAVSACCGGPEEQRCHAGASVSVHPVATASGETMAVLSSCAFASTDEWGEVRRIGEKQGIDMALLREAFLSLPHLDERQLQLLRTALRTMSTAIQLIRQNVELKTRMHKLPAGRETLADLERVLAETDWRKSAGSRPAGASGEKPLLVHVVCELVRQRPELPLSVKELAAAARLTPNHFTTLFRAHAGCSFVEYLTQQRIARAKKLLQNPTLSISEVAQQVGYDDPGYFTRLFRQKTRLSPRQWRNRQAGADAPD